MIACMMLVSTAMFAQKGSTWVGANVNYGMHSDYKNFGLGAKVQYEFIDNFRGEASFNYFFKKDELTQWDVNLNLHYLIHAGSLTVYPLAGLTLLNSSTPDIDVPGFGTVKGVSDSDFGLNLGAGLDFPITEGVKLNIEAKYQIIADWNRPVISAGVSFAL